MRVYRSSVLVALWVLCMACGANVTKHARSALSTAVAATNAARDTFTEWDKAHQIALVDAAITRPEAEQALVDYRAQRRSVVRSFTGAYVALAAAAAILPLVEVGQRPERDLVELLAEAARATAATQDAIKLLRGAP